LVLYGLKRQDRKLLRLNGKNVFSKVSNRMVEWFNEFF